MLQDREKSAKTLSPLSAFKAFADHDKKAITNISVITVSFPWYSSAQGGHLHFIGMDKNKKRCVRGVNDKGL